MTTIKATKPARTPVGAIIFPTGATGKDGVGIASVEQTTTSQEGGGINVITVTKTDGETSTFEIRNGQDGKTGADGHTPVRGTDYWTNDDKTEIINAVLEALPAAEGVSV